MLWSKGVERESPHLDAPRPIFLAGSERALRRLRRCLEGLKLFVSHLPIEGERCVEIVQRARRPAVWLSPWAVGHSTEILRLLERARFVVVHTDGEVIDAPPPSESCLHLSEGELPQGLARLLRFLDFGESAKSDPH